MPLVPYTELSTRNRKPLMQTKPQTEDVPEIIQHVSNSRGCPFTNRRDSVSISHPPPREVTSSSVSSQSQFIQSSFTILVEDISLQVPKDGQLSETHSKSTLKRTRLRNLSNGLNNTAKYSISVSVEVTSSS